MVKESLAPEHSQVYVKPEGKGNILEEVKFMKDFIFDSVLKVQWKSFQN